MKIGIFGDSQVAIEHLKLCEKYNPEFNYDEALEKVWYKQLEKHHDVTNHAQLSRDNLWVDQQLLKHGDKYDLCIVRPAPGSRIHLNVPDDMWNHVHEHVFNDTGPHMSAFKYEYVDLNNKLIKTLHFYHNYIFDQPVARRVERLLAQEWQKMPNVLLLMSHYNKAAPPLFDVEKDVQAENREWKEYLTNKYPGINPRLNTTEALRHIAHRLPNHSCYEAHQLIYEAVMKYIETGVLERPIKMYCNNGWQFPSAVMDLVEEDCLRVNRANGYEEVPYTEKDNVE